MERSMEEYMYTDTYLHEERHWWFLHLRRIITESLHTQGVYARETRNGSAPLFILDDGCGTGMNLVLFSRYGTVIGIDTSPHAISYTRKRGITCLCQANGCALPFKDGSFDIVNSSDVLYTIPPEHALAYLREAYRVLRPGGLLILNTAAHQILYSTHDQAVHTRKRYTRNELKSLLHKSGFRIETLRYWNSALFIPVVLVRLVKKALFLRDEQGKSDFHGGDGPFSLLLGAICKADWAIGKALPIPFGTSLFAVAKK